ncbi:hypothetical protein [Caballeronia choica]|nr:hypothetical protein [Caballeronia choica]
MRLAVDSLDIQDDGEAVSLTVSIGMTACVRATRALPDAADHTDA